jgi:phenylpyruvate tautomerase PptA (4-oxalocrotonate tautomerase family)
MACPTPTAAPGCLAGADGDSTHVQVLINTGVLDRDKQLAVISQLTAIVAAAAGDPSLAGRTWALLTEAPDRGWGLAGHANTNAELAQGRRRDSQRPAPDRQLTTRPTQEGNPHDHDH